jgi:hypothetical protein
MQQPVHEVYEPLWLPEVSFIKRIVFTIVVNKHGGNVSSPKTLLLHERVLLSKIHPNYWNDYFTYFFGGENVLLILEVSLD